MTSLTCNDAISQMLLCRTCQLFYPSISQFSESSAVKVPSCFFLSLEGKASMEKLEEKGIRLLPKCEFRRMDWIGMSGADKEKSN